MNPLSALNRLNERKQVDELQAHSTGLSGSHVTTEPQLGIKQLYVLDLVIRSSCAPLHAFSPTLSSPSFSLVGNQRLLSQLDPWGLSRTFLLKHILT